MRRKTCQSPQPGLLLWLSVVTWPISAKRRALRKGDRDSDFLSAKSTTGLSRSDANEGKFPPQLVWSTLGQSRPGQREKSHTMPPGQPQSQRTFRAAACHWRRGLLAGLPSSPSAQSQLLLGVRFSLHPSSPHSPPFGKVNQIEITGSSRNLACFRGCCLLFLSLNTPGRVLASRKLKEKPKSECPYQTVMHQHSN